MNGKPSRAKNFSSFIYEEFVVKSIILGLTRLLMRNTEMINDYKIGRRKKAENCIQATI